MAEEAAAAATVAYRSRAGAAEGAGGDGQQRRRRVSSSPASPPPSSSLFRRRRPSSSLTDTRDPRWRRWPFPLGVPAHFPRGGARRPAGPAPLPNLPRGKEEGGRRETKVSAGRAGCAEANGQSGRPRRRGSGFCGLGILFFFFFFPEKGRGGKGGPERLRQKKKAGSCLGCLKRDACADGRRQKGGAICQKWAGLTQG